MPDGHAKPIEVLVRQLAENLDIDVVFGKALGVLGRPSFSSQSAICCIGGAPTDMTTSEFWTGTEPSLPHAPNLLLGPVAQVINAA